MTTYVTGWRFGCFYKPSLIYPSQIVMDLVFKFDRNVTFQLKDRTEMSLFQFIFPAFE